MVGAQPCVKIRLASIEANRLDFERVPKPRSPANLEAMIQNRAADTTTADQSTALPPHSPAGAPAPQQTPAQMQQPIHRRTGGRTSPSGGRCSPGGTPTFVVPVSSSEEEALDDELPALGPAATATAATASKLAPLGVKASSPLVRLPLSQNYICASLLCSETPHRVPAGDPASMCSLCFPCRGFPACSAIL